MKKLNYTITTLEPTIITRHSDDPNMYETLQYIRGTVIQGVFAQKYLANKNADELFTRLIVSGDCTFSNAFPMVEGKIYNTPPFALARKKYKPKKVNNLLAGKTTKQTKGISSLVCINGNEVLPLTIRKEIRLHTQINNKTRTSDDGKLFNYQSLPAGMVFKGFIALKEEKDENIIKELIATGTMLRIGRSSTSEYGKVQFDWLENNVEEKLADSGPVIMTLLSDTIIYNENGFSSLNYKYINHYLEKSEIKGYREIEKEGDKFRITNVIARKGRIEGFLNIWKLRKPSENVFVAGSSFYLDKLPQNTQNLVNLGLGERTHEGYGQVSFSLLNPKKNSLKYIEYQTPKLSKPSNIPGLTQKIMSYVSLKRTQEKVIMRALEDANRTKPCISSNHLIGRLKDISYEPEKFNDFLKNLRSTAKNHLENSYVGNKNLTEHFNNILNGGMATTEDLNGLKETDVRNLKVLYFEQYFNQLRRNNIKKERNGER